MIDEQEESFAELFEESLKTERRTVSPGDKVTGTVVQVGSERVLLDLGGGLDAMIDLTELSARGETAVVKKGDRIEAFVLKVENRIAMLAKQLGKGPAARMALEESARTGIPVEGAVVEVNKGGYVIEVAGIRCFCPLGQMDTRRIENPATMIGQRLPFKVTEMRGSRDVVLSRRVLLEETAAEKARETRKRLEKGARFTGTVTGVRDFGAFVDIGGIEGLVPVSQLGFGRVRAQDVVQPGQQVEVEVIEISPPKEKDKHERITLSMRTLASDPWDETTRDLGLGTIVRGTVVRIQPFGAFVEIVPGVDGLLHVSAFGRRVASPSDVVAVGDAVAVRIDAIEPTQRRISLSYIDPKELEGIWEPNAAPAAAPVEEKKAAAPAADGPGMKMRRATKAEEKPAAAAAAPGAKPRVLGHSAVPAPAAPAADEKPARPARAPAEQAAPPVGTVLEVTVDKIEQFGLFVSWGAGRGLLPSAELDVPKGADLRKSHPVGTKLKAAVIEVRGDGKVRLSATQAVQAEERAEARAWMDTQKPTGAAGTKGFGTFADLLKKFNK